MYMKYCTRCNKKSYSSFERDQSECPTCAGDLIDRKQFVASPVVEKNLKKIGKKQLKIIIVKSSYDTMI